MIKFFALLLLYPHFSFANDACQKEVETLIGKLGKSSISILQSESKVRESDAGIRAKKEWSNPSFSIQGLRASGKDPSGDSLQTSVLFPISLGSVRAKSGVKAELEARDQTVQLEIEKRKIQSWLFMTFHRIRQLQGQQNGLKKVHESLTQTLNDFKRRTRRSPEQETVFQTLQLALSDVISKEVLNHQENHALVHDVEIQIGEEWNVNSTCLPKAPASWPALHIDADKIESSLFAEKRRTQIQKAAADAELMKAEKRPVIQIGPAAEWTRVLGEPGFRAGVALQMPLPFENHSGTRALAARTEERQVVEATSSWREMVGELAHSEEIYRQSTAAMAQLPDVTKSDENLKRVDANFRRGLVSGSLYVESLRQYVSYRQNHDELEIRALDSWCKIQTFIHSSGSCEL